MLPSRKSSMWGRLPARSRHQSHLPLAGSTLSVQVRALNSWRCAIILRAPESFEIRGHGHLFFGLEFGPDASHDSVTSGHDEVALDSEVRHAQTVDRVVFVQSVRPWCLFGTEVQLGMRSPIETKSPIGMRASLI